MIIETKFNIGDCVFFLHKEKAYTGNITSIVVDVDIRLKPQIEYTIRVIDTVYEKYERQLFNTKEELIASL